MTFKETDIAFAASQIARIDSGEEDIFRDTVNTNAQVVTKIFSNHGLNEGVFHSCQIYDCLRIHIAFVENTDCYNEEIAAFIRQAMHTSGHSSCYIWLCNENRKITEYLKEVFQIGPEPGGKHHYASTEFIVRREMFNPTTHNDAVEIRQYEEKYMDDYLLMLDGSMTFASPPFDFMKNKNHYLERFNELNKQCAFEAFWLQDELVGLYWRVNAEIDIMAVAEKHQRKGYGSMILTRAIQMVFETTDAEYAYLYAVDWNKKGCAFYQKYGMLKNGHSCLLRLHT